MRNKPRTQPITCRNIRWAGPYPDLWNCTRWIVSQSKKETTASHPTGDPPAEVWSVWFDVPAGWSTQTLVHILKRDAKVGWINRRCHLFIFDQWTHWLLFGFTTGKRRDHPRLATVIQDGSALSRASREGNTNEDFWGISIGESCAESDFERYDVPARGEAREGEEKVERPFISGYQLTT